MFSCFLGSAAAAPELSAVPANDAAPAQRRSSDTFLIRPGHQLNVEHDQYAAGQVSNFTVRHAGNACQGSKTCNQEQVSQQAPDGDNLRALMRTTSSRLPAPLRSGSLSGLRAPLGVSTGRCAGAVETWWLAAGLVPVQTHVLSQGKGRTRH